MVFAEIALGVDIPGLPPYESNEIFKDYMADCECLLSVLRY